MQKFNPPLVGCDTTRYLTAPGSKHFRRMLNAARFFAAVAVVAVVCACSKPPPPPEPTPEPTPVPTPVPTPKPTPTPATPTPVPTPTPVVHHYAPDGVFYVIEDYSAHIKGGLIGVTAGSQVKLLRDNGDSAQVTDGTTPFDIPKAKLTNDLDLAAVLAKREQAVEAATNAARAEQDAVAAKQAQDDLDYLKAHPLGTPTPTPLRRR